MYYAFIEVTTVNSSECDEKIITIDESTMSSYSAKMKRIRAKSKCPNPLFEKWLEEWKEDAASQGSQMQYCFIKALSSLRKCPLRLETGRDCKILQYFGDKLCIMLDKKLTEYKTKGLCTAANSIKPANQFQDPNDCDVNNTDDYLGHRARQTPNKREKKPNGGEPQPAKKTRKLKDNSDTARAIENGVKTNSKNNSYIPAWRSGGYAILLTFYEKMQNPDFIGYMNKADLQAAAQRYCDNSLSKPEPGSYYSAWASMTTLIQKGLVIKSSNPAKYRLTDDGYTAAVQLSEIDENHPAFNNPFPCSSAERNGDVRILSPAKSCSSANSELHSPEVNEPVYEINSRSNSPIEIENRRNEVACSSAVSLARELDVYSAGQIKESANLLNNGEKCKQGSVSSSFETVILAPNTFDVILLVDDREIAGGKVQPKDDITLAELTRAEVRFEVRNLKLGDFTWIARCKSSGFELILPHIVERKRMDDFSGSIRDGRYQEQKFRLKRSGIDNIIYLVENHGNNQHSLLPLQTLFQAATNTLIQDGFAVKYTNSHKDSMFYLASLTLMLNKIYQKKTLIGCNKDDLTSSNILSNETRLMFFKDFNKAVAKVKNFKLSEMFIRQLVQLRGMSVEKAMAIVEFYPTPFALKKAYNDAGSSGENLLASILFGRTQRQLGPVLSRTMHQFYTKKSF
ncbi:crossover junction endonuclease MUS81 isoform X2 [Neodiprion fabricii]|uniref:crossover junction endonuclease MUS81 isoform X2 n=1 Tax=Neodiprion fabricii TaxID=2872261 RepID=UPI001ED98528|nr:crossover junction endonuclease MUS81 isoform X2 [Neodiprion fabricii]